MGSYVSKYHKMVLHRNDDAIAMQLDHFHFKYRITARIEL